MATGRPIDHVVLAANNLDQTATIYERLGFTLTPRAAHEDRMGTSNRITQFQGRNFIELLEVDRPDRLERHAFDIPQPFFSFGDHNRLAIQDRNGLAMLVFQTDDARADMRNFEAAGLQTFEPFNFERAARLPDGTAATLAFSLVFARSPHMPRIAFFVCENRAQQLFWKPEFQRHGNGAETITAIYLASPDPDRDAAFLAAMFGGERKSIPEGVSVSCGTGQEVRVLTPSAIGKLDPTSVGRPCGDPILVGISLQTDRPQSTTPSVDAGGMFIEWNATRAT